jgi:uncharacterized protein YjbI with pentapeptide repeats
VTGGTGSIRSADVSPPVSLADSGLVDSDLVDSDLVDSDLVDSDLEGSVLDDSVLADSDLADSDLADSDLPSPPDLSPSGLLGSPLADSLFGISPIPGVSLTVSALGSSSPGFPRRLSLCLADNLRPSGPRSGAACGATWLSTSARDA